MKTLFIECGAGAAGDMLMSALLELHPDPDDFLDRINKLIPDVLVTRESVEQNGIVGTHLRVKINGIEESESMYDHKHHHEHHNKHEHHHEHRHTALSDILDIIDKLQISSDVKKEASSVYADLAAAEAKVHGREPENIHFHEVGTMDAVCDIVGVCMLINELDVKNIYASFVNVGGGTVKCAHGILPVPAPATAELLRGIPFYTEGSEGERCTPTGAALLKHFVKSFGDMPVMTLEKTGMGAGTKHFKNANILRVFLGDTAEDTEEIYEISCNIDDMTGEDIAFACDMLFKAGAKDVFTTPVFMKKGRPGQLLSCIVSADKKDEIIRYIFGYTSTIGIREHKCKRYVMERIEDKTATKYGDIRFKVSEGFGTKKIKPEFEDIKNAALESGVSLETVRKEIGK